MASLVKDVMNPELFHLRPTDSVEDAVAGLLALGITGAPVLDGTGHPLGMVSLRELAERHAGQAVTEVMAAPALVVQGGATAVEGARLLAESGHHRLVVVDPEGRAVGNVSALDLLRALVGLPIQHPAAFPHLERSTGLDWTDPAPLDLAALEAAPDGAGVLALLWTDDMDREHVVWAEAAHNVYSRLVDILSGPQTNRPVLDAWLSRGSLRFRCAAAGDVASAHEAIRRLVARP